MLYLRAVAKETITICFVAHTWPLTIFIHVCGVLKPLADDFLAGGWAFWMPTIKWRGSHHTWFIPYPLATRRG